MQNIGRAARCVRGPTAIEGTGGHVAESGGSFRADSMVPRRSVGARRLSAVVSVPGVDRRALLLRTLIWGGRRSRGGASGVWVCARSDGGPTGGWVGGKLVMAGAGSCVRLVDYVVWRGSSVTALRWLGALSGFSRGAVAATRCSWTVPGVAAPVWGVAGLVPPAALASVNATWGPGLEAGVPASATARSLRVWCRLSDVVGRSW